MTFTMSSEGDSAKSALSEANEKNATDNHTDSSQDSTDVKEKPQEKPVENNVNTENEQEKLKEETTEEESEQESETSEKKDEPEVKKSDDTKSEDKKPENDTEPVKKEEPKKDKEEKEKEVKGKEEEKDSASDKEEAEEDEQDDEGEEEEEDGSEKEEEVDKKAGKKKGKKGVPLLDQPLETSGKRERKNVQRFEEKVKLSSEAKVEFEEGSGVPLGEIPRVEASITRFKNDDLKNLHKLLFRVLGKTTMLKKNIKRFNGFAFKRDSEEFRKKVEQCRKMEVKYLKSICEMLDLQKGGTKDDLVDRIMEFLMEPKDSGKALGGGRPKRASAVRANNRGYSSHDDYSSDEKQASRARRDKGKRPNLKDESSSDEEFKPGNTSEASDDKPRAVSKRKRGRAKKGSSEEDEPSLSEATSDESEEEPKSKRRKSITKSAGVKAKPKTPSRGRGRPPRAATASTPRKATRGRKAKEDTSEEEDERADDDGSSSEDEPLAKKVKSSEPPTDDEIKTFIKSILEGANLEEITMKTVCQRVYDNYPDFDLTSRKNFIKTTVKSLIST